MFLIERDRKGKHNVVNRKTREIVSTHDNMGDAKAGMRAAFSKHDANKKRHRMKERETKAEAAAGGESGEGAPISGGDS